MLQGNSIHREGFYPERIAHSLHEGIRARNVSEMKPGGLVHGKFALLREEFIHMFFFFSVLVCIKQSMLSGKYELLLAESCERSSRSDPAGERRTKQQ